MSLGGFELPSLTAYRELFGLCIAASTVAAVLALITRSPAAWALAGLAAATGLAACVQYVVRATRP